MSEMATTVPHWNRKHGMTDTPTYRAFYAMHERCSAQDGRHFSRYAGRGIRVCERWCGEDGFENFLADMGERPGSGHSLDRINNDGNYEPSNCRWATPREQRNNRGDTTRVEINGRTLSVTEWDREAGLRIGTVSRRYCAGKRGADLIAPIDPEAQRRGRAGRAAQGKTKETVTHKAYRQLVAESDRLLERNAALLAERDELLAEKERALEAVGEAMNGGLFAAARAQRAEDECARLRAESATLRSRLERAEGFIRRVMNDSHFIYLGTVFDDLVSAYPNVAPEVTGQFRKDVVAAEVRRAVEEEREACALIAEDYDGDGMDPGQGWSMQLGDAGLTKREIAAAIRSRSRGKE